MISEAISQEQLDGVRALLREFVVWHYTRHKEHRGLIDKYFDPESYEAELEALPGEFTGSNGALFLASQGSRAVGCVALISLGDGVCEMKRLFVSPEYHGLGFGLSLVNTVIERAIQLGFHTMRLDTGPNQYEAQALYRKSGFSEIGPYYELDTTMADWLVFFERDLSDIHCGTKTN